LLLLLLLLLLQVQYGRLADLHCLVSCLCKLAAITAAAKTAAAAAHNLGPHLLPILDTYYDRWAVRPLLLLLLLLLLLR
jgi:hypothetical protein